MKKLKKFDKVEVKWMDSNGDTGWTKEDYYKDSEDAIEHFTCGYFLNYTKRAINVVLSRSVWTDKKGLCNVDSLMQIPKVAILSIKKLK